MNGFNLEEHTEKPEEGKDTTYIKTILYNVPEAMCEKIMGKAKSAHSIELGLVWKIVPHPSNTQVVQVKQKHKKK